MSEVISIPFPDIQGDVGTYTAFMRLRTAAATLLNTGGDALNEPVPTLRQFTLTETRVPGADYDVRIYSGTSEDGESLVYDDVLYAGQLIVGHPWNPTVIRGVVGPTSPTTSSFTPSSVSPSGSVSNQWVGRIIVFDNNTITAALRGQVTDITAATAAALPLLSFSDLTNAPVSGDTFVIV